MVGNQKNMFYSQILLSKKGALGIIWIAAHCHKKLKKDQVFQTNIISSVETILKDEVPTVTHRILAYLLLGVVRIYSKKVDYLADDCFDLLAKMKDVPKGKRADIGLESLHLPDHSIILPERFELDAFRLEGLDNQDLSSDHSARSRKEIMLADTRPDEIMCFHSYNKYNEGRFSDCDAHTITHTPVKDVLSPQLMDIDIGRSSSRVTSNLKMSLENIKKSIFLLDDCLEPMTFEDLGYENGLHLLHENEIQSGNEQINMENIHERSPLRDATNLKMGLENINKSMFVLEYRMEPMTFEETGNEVCLLGLSEREIHTGDKQINMVNIPERSPSRDTTNLNVGLENINKSMFVLDDRMEPIIFENPENGGGIHGLFEKEIQTGGAQTNIENIHERRLFLMKHLTSGEERKLSGLDSLPDKMSLTDGKNSGTEIYLEGEPAAITKLVNKDKHVEAEELQNLGVTSPESRMSETPKGHHVSITVDVTPQSKFPAPSGEVLPEVMAIRTPGIKESIRITQKRKCCYDDQLVVPNEMVKCWINDSSDLVCKRRKVPHTAFLVWEAQKISRLPGSFLEPLNPCNSLDFKNLVIEKTCKMGKGYQPASSSFVQRLPSKSKEKNQTAPSLSRKQNQTAPLLFEEQNQTAPLLPGDQTHTAPSFPEKQNQTAKLLPEEQGPTASLLPKVIKDAPLLTEEGAIAPSVSAEQERTIPSFSVDSTFVGCPEFPEVHEVGILEPATPVESMEKCRSPSDEETSDISFVDEEMNSYEGDGNERNYLSVRTRKVAGYLYRRFSQKKREGDEVIKLSRVVKGRSKEESARLFYEILVLKTKDYINVKQKNAYEDIQVMQTPALKQAL